MQTTPSTLLPAGQDPVVTAFGLQVLHGVHADDAPGMKDIEAAFGILVSYWAGFTGLQAQLALNRVYQLQIH